ncbi:MAG: YjbF family lipoprotein [Rhodobacteraceae bacterium]|nr:YjbF family lipoprotein [Paracoccaceae bacterium]
MIQRLARPALLVMLAGSLGLAGCGNTANDMGTAISIAIKSNVAQRRGTESKITQDQVVRTLSRNPNPIALIDLETRKSQSLMAQIQNNRGYRTYATPQRQTVTVRGGMITASRGLGGDLMSSNVKSLLPVVQSRSRGIADYEMRFLNSEDKTYTLHYTCAVHEGAPVQVVSGLINESGKAMQAICTGDGPSFTNTYVVAPDGEILSTRQWMGPFNKYIAFQQLRR